MKSVYFREGQHYSFQELQKCFSVEEEKLTKYITLLKSYSVLKTVRREKLEFSDLSDQDFIIGEIPINSNDFVYQFTFVGVILLHDIVIMCYPKYIDNDKQPREKLKTIIKVLEKYNNSKEQLIHLYNGDAESKVFNKLAISLHILNDYFENGLYSNQHEIIEQNGEGETLWDKSIDECFAIIKNNTPFYLDLYTIDNTENDFDYIKRLHQAIITKCSKDLENNDLTEIFNLQSVELSDESLDLFGDTEYIKYRLENEIKNQFITKKQNLLKTLYTYISEQSTYQSEDSFSLYGTNAFHVIWEKVCAELFNNMYDDKTWNINKFVNEGFINKKFLTTENKRKTISDYIENPLWQIGNNEYKSAELIPDIITLKNQTSGNTALYILDGKYYLINEKDEKLVGNPGVQDVVKQYVYNAAIKSFIDNFRIGEVANVFLIPKLESDNSENLKIANVPYWTMQKNTFNELPTLQVIKLNPNIVWDHYLNNQLINQSVFDAIKTSPTKNYLYHNENDDSIILPHDDKKQILVGYLKPEYFETIKSKECFYFYFYATSKNKEYRFPLHPYIDACKEFIGYTNDKSLFVKGDLQLVNNGSRCKIDEIEANDLTNLLVKSYNKTNHNAATYYVIKVTNSKITKNPYVTISDYKALEKEIKNNCFNQLLYKFSPKIIDV